MKKSTSIKLAPDSVLIGLDWAKQKHDICLLTEDGTFEYSSIEQDGIKLKQWLDAWVWYFLEKSEAQNVPQMS